MCNPLGMRPATSSIYDPLGPDKCQEFQGLNKVDTDERTNVEESYKTFHQQKNFPFFCVAVLLILGAEIQVTKISLYEVAKLNV